MATHGSDHVQNGSSFQVTKSVAIFSPPRKLLSRETLFIAQFLLRIFAVLCSVVAISVLVTSDRTFSVYGIKLTAHYYNSSASRFLLGADVVLCIFSALSLIFVWVSRRSTTNHRKYYYFLFLHDMVMMVLMISGCAAATTVGHIGRYGEEKMGWGAVCQNVPKFCNQTMASLVMSYFVFSSYFVLTIISAHNLVISAQSQN